MYYVLSKVTLYILDLMMNYQNKQISKFHHGYTGNSIRMEKFLEHFLMAQFSFILLMKEQEHLNSQFLQKLKVDFQLLQIKECLTLNVDPNQPEFKKHFLMIINFIISITYLHHYISIHGAQNPQYVTNLLMNYMKIKKMH